VVHRAPARGEPVDQQQATTAFVVQRGRVRSDQRAGSFVEYRDRDPDRIGGDLHRDPGAGVQDGVGDQFGGEQ
jgi:hypothetical protein